MKRKCEEIEETIVPSFEDKEFLKDRVIFFEKEFTEESCNEMKKKLMYLFTHNSKKPITIYISSYGGDVYDFLTLYGLIKTAPCEIITIALGKCMSAGADLLLMGDKRMAYPQARIMLHELSYEEPYSKLHEQRIEFKESEEVQKILNDIAKEKTKIENVDEFVKEDKYLSPEEALELGIIDEIIK